MTETTIFEWIGGEGQMSKKEINGNTYILVMWNGNHPKRKRHIKHRIKVYADPISGADNGFGEHPSDLSNKYDVLVTEDVTKYDRRELETVISQTINEAVCTVEDKQDELQGFEDKVTAALEANAEIHGGIDYALEKEKS